MNRIDEKFKELKEKGEKALIAYFTAGLPSVNGNIEIIRKSEQSGVDIVEIGVPFSDPIADGPIIQYASNISLEKGTNTDTVFEICRELKDSVDIPYLLMTYYNPVYRYGIEKFSKRCAQTGVSGIIIPDLPFEESKDVREALKKQNVHLINFLTPFTPKKRAKSIIKASTGFIYFITSAGVTGPREKFSEEMWDKLKIVKEISRTPVASGFGISDTAQVKRLREYVDGVIIGSFFVKKIIDGKIEELWKEIREIKKALAREN
ncbi:MAG: tryptophan synthase subunit alpha [Candidatus Omnitrophica bacterium]|nr:tryptophan synthase subunit alpha [Candidatus Omnitrophota bacterium]